MKKFTLLILILLLTIVSYSQGHFTKIWTGNGTDQMTFYVYKGSIDGISLQAGDEIAFFDGTYCVGVTILTSIIDESNYDTWGTIICSSSDGVPKNGFTNGNTISIKLWDASQNKEITNVSAGFFDVASMAPIDGLKYTPNESAVVSLTAISPINQIPVANAGADQTVNEGATVAMDGSASSDPDNSTLTYLWTAPAGITLNSTTVAKPTFTAPEVSVNTNYTFTLVVNDGTASSVADQVIVTVRQVNKEPIANAGLDQSVNEGSTVTLDGSASSDPDNTTLTYLWTAPAGVTLSSTTISKPTFTAPEVSVNTNYTFTLVVSDGALSSKADEVIVTVKQVNKEPIANAGVDQSVNEGSTVTLDGTASSDPDNTTITYLWTAPTGITLSSTTVAKPTFTAPEVTSNTPLTFTLVVSDGALSSKADQVIVTVRQVNKEPIANAGSDQTVNEGTTVTLDGSASSDPDNTTLTYLWTAPTGITLSSTTVAKPTFTAPEVTSNTPLTFTLVVSDGALSSKADQVVITVNQENKIPIANAGVDQSINEGATVTLDGSASTDGDNNTLTYLWTAPTGITLSSATVQKPTFTAPEVTANTNYTFTLVVNDGSASSLADQVIITIRQVNKEPIANAGVDQSVNEGSTVTLDGSASSDPDNTTLTYLWTAPAGVTLSSTTIAKPTFTAPEVSANTNYTLTLIVSDGALSSKADQVIVTVRQVNKEPIANAGSDQTVNEGTTVTLDGSASSDPDNTTLTYLWTAPTGITLSSTTIAKPTFIAPEVSVNTNYTFTLVVSDGALSSKADEIVITVNQVNKLPVANAGVDQSVIENSLVTLDGSKSTDPDNDAITYQWTAPIGITLSSATAQKPTFTAPEVSVNTNYTFTLVVNDGKANSVAHQIVITVKQDNKIPVANAGIDKIVNEGVAVTLDASASTDPDNDALTYKWTAPAGITLSSATAQKPTFTAPEVTANSTYVFTLVVNDGIADSPADQVTITVNQVNKIPVANAGVDQSINEGATVTLDGSASTDGDNNTLTYLWTAPAGITLSSTTVAKPTFSAPEVSANTNYTFTLVVNDGIVSSIADQVIVTVRQVNKEPIANAGIDQSINEGTSITLDGTASSDPDNTPLTYLWTAPTGITLSSTTVAKPTFTAPEVSANTNYTFSLVVSDGALSSKADQVVVTVIQVNKAPIANAGLDKEVTERKLVQLDGGLSSDPDNTTITYLWTTPTGITLSSNTVAKPTFIAPEVTVNTNYTFSLKVNDGTVDSPTDQVTITVVPNKAPVANAGVDQIVPGDQIVYLSGKLSADPDSDPLTYQWTAPDGITLMDANTDHPSFKAPNVTTPTDIIIKLKVNDGELDSPEDEVTIKAVKNQPPVANAGINFSVNEGEIVYLNGSSSYDPDNNTLTYSWIAPSGIVLNPASGLYPSFTAPQVNSDMDYIFKLVVNDGLENSAMDEVVVTIKQINKAPVANAGADQTVLEGTIVSLDASASSDPDNTTITYLWTAPPGITLSSNTVAKPTFTAPDVSVNTEYIFGLVVNDGTVNSGGDKVIITVTQVNKEPVANAGADKTVNEGSTVTLDGSASSDPDNNTLRYLWTAPAGITLSYATAQKPTFTAPEVSANTSYTFTLVVSDGTLSSKADEVVVTVTQVNKTPVANAGVDQSINEGSTATLDGSASTDGDNNALTYLWTAPAGITLSSTTAAKPTFTAPEVSSNTNYTFTLHVNDGTTSSVADQVIVTVRQVNKEPIANAAADQSVNEGTTVTLDGSASSDPDNTNLTYLWTAPAGITLSSATAAKPTFTAPEVMANTNYTITLVVSDGALSSKADQVVITVNQVNKAPVANAGVNQFAKANSLFYLNGTASSDPDKDPITYQWTAPAGITLNSYTTASPSFTTPTDTTDKELFFTLVVNDGKVNSLTDTVVITVIYNNSSPMAINQNLSLNEDEKILFDLKATDDMPVSQLSYIIKLNPEHGTLYPGFLNYYIYKPSDNYSGMDEIQFEVKDVNGESATGTVYFTINPVNDKPVLTVPMTTYTIEQDGTAEVSVEMTDTKDQQNAANLHLLVVTNPLNGQLSAITETGSFTYTPAPGFSGKDFIQVQAEETNTAEHLKSAISTIYFNVTKKNQPPVAFSQQFTLPEDDTVSFSLSGVDPEDGLTNLNYSITQMPVHGNIVQSVNKILYTPSSNYFGEDEIQFTVKDKEGLISNTAKIALSVLPVNDRPTAQYAEFSIDGKTEYTFDMNNLISDVETQSDLLKVAFFMNGGILGGTVTQQTGNTFKYNKANNPLTEDYLLYWVMDENLTSYAQIIRITNIEANKSAKRILASTLAVNDTVDVWYNQPVSVEFAGLDCSLPFGKLNLALSAQPKNGLLNDFKFESYNGTVLTTYRAIYSPSVNESRIDSAEFKVSGSDGESTGKIYFRIHPVDIAPKLQQLAIQSIDEDTQGKINIEVDDKDSELSALSWKINNTTVPGFEFAIKTENAKEVLVVTPPVNYHGTSQINLVVTDQKQLKDSIQFLLSVNAINDSPVLLSNKSWSAYEDEPFEFDLIAMDPDGDAINLSISDLPAGFTLQNGEMNNAVLSGNATNDLVGMHDLNLLLSDGKTQTPVVLALSVINTDDAPYVKSPIAGLTVHTGDQPTTIDLSSIFADDDLGDVLSYSVIANTNDSIVKTDISGDKLILSYSEALTGIADFVIAANSNGKTAQTNFNVQVDFHTGIVVLEEESSIQVYPNPTEGNVYLKFSNTPKAGTWVTVTDVTGRTILRKLADHKETLINLEGNVKGMYFINVNQKTLKSYKVILK